MLESRSGALWFALLAISASGAGSSCVSTAAAETPGRGYELVTPSDTAGAAVEQALNRQATDGAPTPIHSAAPNGERVAFGSGIQVIPGFPNGINGPTYMAERSANGWQTYYTNVPSRSDDVGSAFLASWAEDLSRNIISTPSRLSPDDPTSGPGGFGRDLFGQNREQYGTAAFDWVTRSSVAQGPDYNTLPADASADARTVLFTSNIPLTADNASSGSLYVSRDPGLDAELLSVYPDGSPAVGVSQGQLSDNGQVATFSAQASPSDPTPHAFVRLISDRTTLDIGPAPIAVDQISADGGTITLSTDAQLTSDDNDSSYDVYTYDVASRTPRRVSKPAAASGVVGNTDQCTNTIVDSAQGGSPLPGCSANVIAATNDGDVVYFLSPEVLTVGGARQDAANLYAASGGAVSYVTTLTSSDLASSDAIGRIGYLTRGGSRPVRMSADGSKLLFESNGDPLGRASGGSSQVYVYDVASRTLACASCSVTEESTLRPAYLAARDGRFGNSIASAGGGRNVTDDGTSVFFETASRLANEDRNEKTDVYEYSVTTGDTSLVSGGRGGASYYIDSGADGRDVFFLTRNTLVSADQNGEVSKLYDARRGGGFPEPVRGPNACVGVVCSEGAAAPTAPANSTGEPGPSDNAHGSGRITVRLSGPDRAERDRAHRSGRVAVRVRVSRSVTVRIVARARLRGRTRVVGSRGVFVRANRRTTVSVPLNARGRAALQAGALRLALSASASKARTRTISTTLGGAR